MISHFGSTSAGEPVEAIRLAGGELTAVILTQGAILQDLRLAGVPHSLTLGSDQLAAYEGPMGFFGAVVGPVANRIGGAQAVVGGRTCRFEANEGPNLLHGGASGTWAQNWRIEAASEAEVTLGLSQPDGLGGFPGNREISAHFALSGQALTLTLSATTDAPTLINLANHSYWTLDGRPDIAGHSLRVAADRYLPVDAALLPLGPPEPVSGAFDLRAGRRLDLTEGFDHNFCLADAVRPRSVAAELTGQSGVRMVLETTEPGLQVYDGRGIATAPYPGHAGQPYGPHAGIALEAQRWPDAPAHADYPSIGLVPGESYRQVTRYSFDRP
jgi:aldose 1-epimerase